MAPQISVFNLFIKDGFDAYENIKIMGALWAFTPCSPYKALQTQFAYESLVFWQKSSGMAIYSLIKI